LSENVQQHATPMNHLALELYTSGSWIIVASYYGSSGFFDDSLVDCWERVCFVGVVLLVVHS
jgi:hypothetical protein